MVGILDQIQKSTAHLAPRSVEEFVGLQLAKRLHDEGWTRSYLVLASRHPLPTIVAAYHATRRAAVAPQSLREYFHASLERQHCPDTRMRRTPLISFRIDRRAVAVAVFVGMSHEYSQVRELPSNAADADRAAVGFIAWVLSHFSGCSVALEEVRAEADTRRRALHLLALETIRNSGTPVWEVSPRELLTAYAAPGCRTRAQFRAIVAGIWPNVKAQFSNRSVLDAVGLGLLVQAKRLLDAEEHLTRLS